MGNLISRKRSHTQRTAPPPQNRSNITQSGNTGSPEIMQACLGASTPPITPNKKALLIGVRYKKGRWPASSSKKSMDLKDAPHKETQTWREMLIHSFGYTANQITSMQDISKYKGTNQWPNRENILAQLEDLVRDVKHGDQRFLFIAAHGDQRASTSDWTELDDRDEIMYTLENDKRSCLTIKDNDLQRILVESLPTGVTLTIVLELCHSGTLMDLPFQLRRNDAGLLTLDPAKKNPIDLQGNILCLSACEDSQNAYHFTRRSSRPEQGIITSIIQETLAHVQGRPNLRVKDLHDVLVEAGVRSSKGGAAQTPMVTLGRRLSERELETLVFRP